MQNCKTSARTAAKKTFKCSLLFRPVTLAAILMLAAVFLSSCDNSYRDNTKRTESGINFVGRYEIIENDMKYVVYREVDGGLFIINTTKDSLDVAIARQKLSSVK
jgi:hypothetical protein